jgi:hypothetical protein
LDVASPDVNVEEAFAVAVDRLGTDGALMTSGTLKTPREIGLSSQAGP